MYVLNHMVVPAFAWYSPEIDDPPHVGPEPHGGAGVGLVLADEDGVRHRQQPHQRAMLQELQDLRLVCQTPGGERTCVSVVDILFGLIFTSTFYWGCIQ